jgi:CheY-like chemotaxis protein
MIMSQKKILIIDDSLVVLKALSGLLQARGYSVLTAQDASVALLTVRREIPDLILLDINFPLDVGSGGGLGWDGFQIMGWLRRMDEAKEVPIIIITGDDPAKYKDRCRAPEVVGCFRKPVDHEELLAVIRKTLEGRAGDKPPLMELPGDHENTTARGV